MMRIFDVLSKKPKKTFVNNTNLEKELSKTLVRDGMSKQWILDPYSIMPLQTIDPNESILDAANQTSLKKIRKSVVENNKVVGIMTSTDLTNQYLGLKIKSIK